MRVPSFISFIMLTCIFLCSCTKNQELNLDVTEIASLKLPENVRGVNEIINASQFRSCDMPTSTTFVGFFGADKANGVTVNIFASSDEAYSEFRMEFERDSFCLDKNNSLLSGKDILYAISYRRRNKEGGLDTGTTYLAEVIIKVSNVCIHIYEVTSGVSTMNNKISFVKNNIMQSLKGSPASRSRVD